MIVNILVVLSFNIQILVNASLQAPRFEENKIVFDEFYSIRPTTTGFSTEDQAIDYTYRAITFFDDNEVNLKKGIGTTDDDHAEEDGKF